MLNEQTIGRLMDLRLREMARSFRAQMQDNLLKDMSFDDRFGLLVDAQWSQRKNRRIDLLRQKAAFKFPHACMEDIDYSPDRRLDRGLLLELSQCKYIRDSRNILIMGVAGAGKTYLSNALGVAACKQLYKVKYIRMPEMLVDMNMARGDGSYRELMASYKKIQLLILDEWMHQPISDTQASDVFEIVEARYMASSTIFVAQSEPEGWHRQVNNGTLADSIVDRIAYNSYDILLNGEVNMRERMGFRR